MTDLLSQTIRADHRDLICNRSSAVMKACEVTEVIKFNREVKLCVISIAMLSDTTGGDKQVVDVTEEDTEDRMSWKRMIRCGNH